LDDRSNLGALWLDRGGEFGARAAAGDLPHRGKAIGNCGVARDRANIGRDSISQGARHESLGKQARGQIQLAVNRRSAPVELWAEGVQTEGN
jgi:hypothetical protein